MQLNYLGQNTIKKRVQHTEVRHLVYATAAELINLPEVSSLSPGSTVTITDTGVCYTLDANRVWQKTSEDKEEEDELKHAVEVIYDGGELI